MSDSLDPLSLPYRVQKTGREDSGADFQRLGGRSAHDWIGGGVSNPSGGASIRHREYPFVAFAKPPRQP